MSFQYTTFRTMPNTRMKLLEDGTVQVTKAGSLVPDINGCRCLRSMG